MITTAQLEKIETRADHSIKLIFGTQELTSQDMVDLFQFNNSLVKLYISDKGISSDVVDELDSTVLDISPTVKSPSQRLRGVLYRLYEVDNEGYQDFNLFYLNKMERIIDWIKQKLD